MSEEEIHKLHADLGFAFSRYVAKHADWPLLDQLPRGTTLVFQIDEPDFNAWELRRAVEDRKTNDEPDRPITLIYIPVPDPPSADQVAWENAKVLASFAVKADYKEQTAPV